MKKLYDEKKVVYLQSLSYHPIFATTNKKLSISAATIHYYPKGSLIYLQYAKVRYLYFLLEGVIHCYRQQPNGQESLINRFDTNKTHIHQVQMINESLPNLKVDECDEKQDEMLAYNQYNSFGKNSCHQLTAKASQNSYVAILPIHEIKKTFNNSSLATIFTWYAEQMYEQISTQFLLYDLLSLKTAQAKVAYYLLCHADNNSKIEISMSQKNLASLLSIRAETLSRTLRSLINQQIISVNGVQYTILKPEHLEQIVEQ